MGEDELKKMAKDEFRRIIEKELPLIKKKLNKNREWVPATKGDRLRIKDACTRLGHLFALFERDIL